MGGRVSVPACTTGHMTRGVSVQEGLCLGGSVWGGLCPGVSVQGVSVQGSLSRGSLSRGSLSGVSVQGSLSRGSLSRGGLYPVGSLSRVSLSRGSLSGEICIRGVSIREIPHRETGCTHPTGMHSCYFLYSQIMSRHQSIMYIK